MLSVQIDAAINPGNSGGPVIHNGKIAGIVMQGLRGADNIGYMVPTPTIKHFFNDIKDGKYDGFPDLGIIVQAMENIATRKKFNLDESTSGVLVYKILHNSPARNHVQPGDIITAIDKHTIANDGTVEFRPKEYTSYGYYIDQHQVGDTLELELIRDAKKITVQIPLTTTSKDFRLVQREAYDKFPRYFIFGGFVFTPVTKDYILSGASLFSTSSFNELMGQWPDKERTEPVIISQVLASDTNKGHHNLYDWLIKKINGQSFKNFDEFYEIMGGIKGDFITLEDEDGYQVVIDRVASQKESKKILKRYHINASRSKDFDLPNSNNKKRKANTVVTNLNKKKRPT